MPSMTSHAPRCSYAALGQHFIAAKRRKLAIGSYNEQELNEYGRQQTLLSDHFDTNEVTETHRGGRRRLLLCSLKFRR